VTGGLLLVVGGIWVLSQVLGGNALGRLGISGQGTQPGTTKTAPNTATASGSRDLMPSARAM